MPKDIAIKLLDKYQEHFLICIKSHGVEDEELYIVKQKRQ